LVDYNIFFIACQGKISFCRDNMLSLSLSRREREPPCSLFSATLFSLSVRCALRFSLLELIARSKISCRCSDTSFFFSLQCDPFLFVLVEVCRLVESPFILGSYFISIFCSFPSPGWGLFESHRPWEVGCLYQSVRFPSTTSQGRWDSKRPETGFNATMTD